ncbi:MAG: UvrB/UvrC motif-containing protein [Candidatus Chisholmbacteria bacterium]|nr:UvrB/UvrC motif-containing protein [Candidatus Chisholmbacteria bacterium]
MPGVYWFENASRQILYIGKAKNIRHRLRSYRLKVNQIGKTKRLLSQTHTLRFCVVDSELQALILEAHLIHTFTPKYNIRLKDDRSPLYIIITAENFPRVLTARKSQLHATSYPLRATFGPFPSGFKTRLVLKLVRRVFPFCNASSRDKEHHRACFYSHLGLCPGACTGSITRRQYLFLIRQLAEFLRGNEAVVIKTLKKKMQAASSNRDFETAAAYRDQLELLENLRKKSISSAEVDELESEVVGRSQLQVAQETLSLSGLPLRIEGYDIANLQGKYSVGSLVVFVNGRPSPAHYRYFKIKTVVGPNDPASLAEVVKRRLNHPEWATPDLLIIDGGAAQVNAVKNTLHNYKLKVYPVPTGTGAKSLPRNEAVRGSKLLWGKIPIVGIAKREELLILSPRKTSAGGVEILNQQALRLSRRSPALKLVQHVRDEAHRFARTLYHKLHQKDLLQT